MTDEEIEQEAEFYAEENYTVYVPRVALARINNKEDIKKAYLDGCEQGMKKVCEICEQHMLEEHPDACGCAFRRLGNKYCWE